LMQLILAAKEFDAPDMDEQEYLDREGSFTVHLVLDEQEQWVKMQIYVNDWIIVLQSIEW
ncbi:MAG: FimB/Mfa2 family fimbrial subunit, partial [Muribaculaceae bacterium]|nr:FimB/Mfa2 family fimbrial subunit [Muribaculaceae bacterium]